MDGLRLNGGDSLRIIYLSILREDQKHASFSFFFSRVLAAFRCKRVACQLSYTLNDPKRNLPHMIIMRFFYAAPLPAGTIAVSRDVWTRSNHLFSNTNSKWYNMR